MNTQDSAEKVVAQLVLETRRVFGAGAVATTAILVYVIIDSMARAGLPPSRGKVNAQDFKDWVDAYMHSREPAEYRYSGADIYAARCALLHEFRASKDPKVKHIAYHDGSHHRYRPDKDPDLVILSVSALVDDLWSGVNEFLVTERRKGTYLIVAQRLGEMYRSYQLPTS